MVAIMIGALGPQHAEMALAAFWTAYVASGRRGVRYALRHPVDTFRALRALRDLPVVEVAPSDGPGGRAVDRALSRRGPAGTPARWLGSAVLTVPADPADRLVGSSAQTLRRRLRRAERLGISCRAVSEPTERAALLDAANRCEREHVDARYRVADPDNRDLPEHGLWLVAQDRDKRPLLLAVAPVDGSVATLRYFRTLGRSAEHTESRYLATQALVEELAARGVRHLLDTEPPGAQTNGLREFQRMVGFRYVRLRRRTSPSAVA